MFPLLFAAAAGAAAWWYFRDKDSSVPKLGPLPSLQPQPKLSEQQVEAPPELKELLDNLKRDRGERGAPSTTSVGRCCGGGRGVYGSRR